ncbi:MAG: YceD family protein [Acidimicrobiales bacterium]
MNPLRIPVAEILGRPGATRPVSGDFALPGLALDQTGSAAVGDITVELEISAIVEGLAVSGRVAGAWAAECRRCLDDVGGDIEVAVNEIFEDEATEAETWPIEAEHIDLEPLVREAVLLALPLSPLCGPQCAGPDPDRFPTTGREADRPEKDPRWAALDDLEL